jgi:hypothetical protein
MKYLRSIPYLTIFLTNLLIGYLGGLRVLPTNLRQAASNANSTAIITDTPIPSLANGQRSLLLLTVDQLETHQPQLTGIWLVLYVPSDPRLTLMPIYPAPDMNDSGKEFSDAFKLETKAGALSPDPVFLDLIKKQVPWWSGYILLDEAAIGEVINFMANFQQASKSLETNHFSQIVPELKRWEDPYSALFGQASLYQEMCWGMAWMESGVKLVKIQDRFHLMEGHFSTDLAPDQLLAELQNLRGQGGSIVCEFPTLSVQARIVK